MDINITERRKKLGITQEELAKRSGFSLSFIQKVEAGIRKPSLNSEYKIWKCLVTKEDEEIAKRQYNKMMEELFGGLYEHREEN